MHKTINRGVTPSFFVATLRSLTTDKTMTGYQKYVQSNAAWAEMELTIERASNITSSRFFKLNKTDTWSPLPSGTSLQIVENQLDTVGSLDVLKCRANGHVGYIPINRIRKPNAGADVMSSQRIAMGQLGDLLQRFVRQTGPITICLNNGEKYPNCYDVQEVTRTINGREAKSDFNIVDPDGNAVLYISHKKSGTGSSYQQYGGVSARSSGSASNRRLIYDHPEVQRFMRELAKEENHNGTRLIGPRYARVQDVTLVSQSAFGPDYNSGRGFGEDFCQIIGQGEPQLTWKGDEICYTLTFSSHTSYWNQPQALMTHPDYAPFLCATYRAGRGWDIDGERYDGARLGIYPWGFMSGRGGQEEI